MLSRAKVSIWVSALVTALSIAGLAVIMSRVDPFQASWTEKLIFFAALFVSLWGTSSFVIFALRRFEPKKKETPYLLHSSFAWGILAAAAVFGIYFLKTVYKPTQFL